MNNNENKGFISTIETLQLSGTIYLQDEELPVHLRVSYEKYAPKIYPLEITFLQEGKAANAMMLRALREVELKVVGTYSTITIKEIIAWQGSDQSFTITSEKLVIEQQVEKTEKRTLLAVAILTGAGILKENSTLVPKYDGTIEKWDSESKPVQWQFRNSLATAQIGYHITNIEIAGNKSRVQIAHPSIGVVFESVDGETLLAAAETFESEVREICMLLSFCYRQPVDIANILIRDKKSESQNTLQVIYSANGSEGLACDPLIDIRFLRENGLATLIKNYRDSLNAEFIRQAISTMVASRVERMIESRYFLSLISLEMLVGRITHKHSEATWYTDEVWKTISEVLNSAVNELKSKLTEEECGKLINGVSLLNRFPFRKQILLAVKISQIEVRDLWPKTGFGAGIKRLIDDRNDLVHNGHVDSQQILAQNLLRTQTLVEKFILHLLSWPISQLAMNRDQSLRWMNLSSEGTSDYD